MNKPKLVSMRKRWGLYSPAMRYFMMANYDAIEFRDRSIATSTPDHSLWFVHPHSPVRNPDSHAYDFCMMTRETTLTWQPTSCTYHPLSIEERNGIFYLIHNHVIIDQASTSAAIQKKWAEWLDKL